MAHSRRQFLQIAGGAAVSSALPFPAQQQPQPADSPRIRVWVTAGIQRYAEVASLPWQAAPAAPGLMIDGNTIGLDPSRRFQQILGFGAAFTDASCYMFHQLAENERVRLFQELFSREALGLNVCRCCVGSSDYATKVYSYVSETPDPELKSFSIAHDRQWILPSIKQARQINPDLFLFSSPWSPPGWMKTSGKMLGGSMDPKWLAQYARYYLKFLRAYRDEGVQVDALTSQNEVDTDQNGKMPACLWPAQVETAFVRDHLAPLLGREGVDTKIWILDHNYDLWERVVQELNDKGLKQSIAGVAWHGYLGTPDMMSKAKERHPDVDFFWTEGGPAWDSPKHQTDWADWGKTITDTLNNWCRCFVGWNLSLDEVGKPNIGPFNCAGLVTIHSKTREITRSGQYWAIAHFSKAIRRGATRIATESKQKDVNHIAFENPDGELAIVLTNPGAETTVWLRQSSQIAEVHLPAYSVATLAWT